MGEIDQSGLLERIERLQETVRALRASRRVLMSLLSVAEQQRRARVGRLEGENERLRRTNRRFARVLLERNAHICRLEAELRRVQAAAAVDRASGSAVGEPGQNRPDARRRRASSAAYREVREQRSDGANNADGRFSPGV